MELRRIPAPTDEELAEKEDAILRRQAEEEFEANRQKLEAQRPRGAAKLSRTRAFNASIPPMNRGAAEYEPPPDEEQETPAEALRRANGTAQPPVAAVPSKPDKKKSRFDVPDAKTASTVIDKLGVVYVEEKKAKGPSIAFENLRTNIMLNLSLLLPMMPQIKQMFELLQIGEPERDKKGDGNGKQDRIEELTGGLRRFLQGDDE
jgi:hypothetical protein